MLFLPQFLTTQNDLTKGTSMNTSLQKAFLITLLCANTGLLSMDDSQTDGKQEKDETPLKVAILASGNGSNAEEIWKYFEQPDKQGIINAAVMICDRKENDAGVYKRARRHKVPTVYLPAKVFKKMGDKEKEARRKEHAKELIKALKEYGVTPENGLVCGAGWMVIIHKDFLDYFQDHVISIHPTLLPALPGEDGIERAFKRGVKVSGPTVHFVDEGMDTGPIIGQNSFDVADDDTLESFEQKTHEAEWKLFPSVIEQIAQGKIEIVNKSADGGPERAVIGFKLHD